ncbi:MAG: hypothetical protein KBC84_09460 [Proteobacteria bacterium]|nr:hypothetical protein [Pseudomonadota bacterium]
MNQYHIDLDQLGIVHGFEDGVQFPPLHSFPDNKEYREYVDYTHGD